MILKFDEAVHCGCQRGDRRLSSLDLIKCTSTHRCSWTRCKLYCPNIRGQLRLELTDNAVPKSWSPAFYIPAVINFFFLVARCSAAEPADLNGFSKWRVPMGSHGGFYRSNLFDPARDHLAFAIATHFVSWTTGGTPDTATELISTISGCPSVCAIDWTIESHGHVGHVERPSCVIHVWLCWLGPWKIRNLISRGSN